MKSNHMYMARFCYRASLVLLIGILASGPLGNLFVNAISPQPNWIDIRTYADHFHPVQMLPVWAGFLMITGFTVLVAGIHYSATVFYKPYTLLAVVSATVYCSLISLNYILQLGVLQPALLNHQLEGMTFLVFANPHSVTMSVEMVGYAFQGVSTWLIISAIDNSILGKWTKRLSVANGVVSIAGALFQGLNISLAINSPIGIAAFVGWNVLFTILCLLYVFYFGKKIREIEAIREHVIPLGAGHEPVYF